MRLKRLENKEIERNNKMKIIRDSSGITLIALVVTVIVLLILTGISIQMLTGSNRNFTAGRESKGTD